jgi:hypothetical protein
MKYKSRTEPGMTAKEIFSEINRRQIIAQMFHREMAIYFSFLGLQGFKRQQEYRYRCEASENVNMLFWIIDHHNMLIETADIPSVSIIPKEWLTVSRLNVGQNTKTTSAKSAFDSWREWEEETLHLYEQYAKMLMESGDMEDCCKVNQLMKNTGCELKRLERQIEEYQLVGYDPVYLAEIQKKMHDKYKKKMHL